MSSNNSSASVQEERSFSNETVNNLYNSEVIFKLTVAPGLFILRVKPDSGIKTFKAGQYVALGLVDEETLNRPKPKVLKRAYSIGSSPIDCDYLEFYIAAVNGGTLTPRLINLAVGDRLFVAPKITGTFVLDDVPARKNLVLVSTGTGLAPFMSMVRTEDTLNNYNKITIVHGVRYHKDLGYREELEELEKTLGKDKFSYQPLSSRDEPDSRVKKGYVQSLFIEGLVKLDPSEDHVFACGNPNMVEDLEKYLVESLGYTVNSKKSPGNLHLEKYW